MKRISTTTKVPDKFGAGKHGFTDGNVLAGVPATDLEGIWFDNVQEEVATVIEAAGLELDGNDLGQLLKALRGAGLFQTAPQFDGTTKVATMEALKRDRFGYGAPLFFNATAALTPQQLGNTINLGLGAGAFTLTLPALQAGHSGSAVRFTSYSPNPVTISSGSSAKIWNGMAGGGSGTSFVMRNGDTAQLVTDGSAWFIVEGTVLLSSISAFAGSLAANGYQKLPGGLILQWGVAVEQGIIGVAIGATSYTQPYFPIPFPTACVCCVPTLEGVSLESAEINVGCDVVTKTYATVRYIRVNGSSNGNEFFKATYIALGY